MMAPKRKCRNDDAKMIIEIIGRMMHAYGDVYHEFQAAADATADEGTTQFTMPTSILVQNHIFEWLNNLMELIRNESDPIASLRRLYPLPTASFYRWAEMKKGVKSKGAQDDDEVALDDDDDGEEDDLNFDEERKGPTATSTVVTTTSLNKGQITIPELNLTLGGRARLSRQNDFTAALTSEQYTRYVHCREASFVRPANMMKKFRALIGGEALSRVAIQLLSYLASDRVACIVEVACALRRKSQRDAGKVEEIILSEPLDIHEMQRSVEILDSIKQMSSLNMDRRNQSSQSISKKRKTT